MHHSGLIFPLMLGAALAACGPISATTGPQPSVSLPPAAVQGAGAPVDTAITTVSDAFSSPQRLAGQPALAARAIADMEFLAVDLPDDPRFPTNSGTLQPQLLSARQEWRSALGIAPGAPPQAVINALYAASRDLSTGQPGAAAAALPPAIFSRGGQATIALLANLPGLPQTNVAAVDAADMLVAPEGLGPRRP